MWSTVSILAKRFGQVRLSNYLPSTPIVASSAASSHFHSNHDSPIGVISVRTFAKKAKGGNKKKTQAQGTDLVVKKIKDTTQRDDWLKFQESISVRGFDTGQDKLKVQVKKYYDVLDASRRGRKEETTTRPQRPLLQGQYRALRYSEEETERLLAQAYAKLPPREGKRGNRQAKRHRRRQFLGRKMKRICKINYGRKTHERRMLKRSANAKAIRAIKQEAPDMRKRDAIYQQFVLTKWIEATFMGTAAALRAQASAAPQEDKTGVEKKSSID